MLIILPNIGNIQIYEEIKQGNNGNIGNNGNNLIKLFAPTGNPANISKVILVI